MGIISLFCIGDQKEREQMKKLILNLLTEESKALIRHWREVVYK
jgi:hypothetical protein